MLNNTIFYFVGFKEKEEVHTQSDREKKVLWSKTFEVVLKPKEETIQKGIL